MGKVLTTSDANKTYPMKVLSAKEYADKVEKEKQIKEAVNKKFAENLNLTKVY